MNHRTIIPYALPAGDASREKNNRAIRERQREYTEINQHRAERAFLAMDSNLGR
jgi:hypothetical protein